MSSGSRAPRRARAVWDVRRVRLLLAVLAVLAVLCSPASAQAQARFDQNAMIFVHGFAGSGAQFESQKMRFVSNGYPEGHVAVLEYDSTFATEPRAVVYARLDELIERLKQQTGRPRVDVLGHSLGTTLMHEYLSSSPERAANVAHYVNIDGRTADSPPGAVPTLAVWAGRGEPGRSIGGARNVTIDNQTHVEVATSAESFVEYYRFLTGRSPSTDAIVPEPGPAEIEGRAVLFPQNRGLPGGVTVEVWPVDAATGQRSSATPTARLAVDGDGSWGPVEIQTGRHYEFALLRPGVSTLHYYFEPFLRSDRLVRLLYSDAVQALVERSEGHVGALVLRYKELWGDQGAQSDVLTFNGTSACNPATCPIDERVNAVFAFDRGSDRQSDLSEPHPVFSQLPFITGVDIFMPAARPPTGTTSVSLRSRGSGPVRTINFPNFPSTTDGAVIAFSDFERPVTSAGAAPRLRVSARPRRVRAGTRRRFALRVTARVDGRTRSIDGATVRFGGRSARTGADGRVTITARLRSAGVHRARATRPGYQAGRTTVRAVGRLRQPSLTG